MDGSHGGGRKTDGGGGPGEATTSTSARGTTRLLPTEASAALLRRAASSETVDPELRNEAKHFTDAQEPIPWTLLHALCSHFRGDSGGGSGGPWLHQVAAGGGLHLPKAPERIRSPELEARLAKLKAQYDEQQYESLTADVTKMERAAKNKQSFSTFKDQIGFGVHVVVMMFTLYMVGTYGARAFSDSPLAHLCGGLVGAILGMFMEVILFIIRTTKEEEAAATPNRKGQSAPVSVAKQD